MTTLRAALAILWTWWGILPALAGLAPVHTLVVVNDNEPASVELGRFYAGARGIPDANLLHVALPYAETISTAVFTNDLRNPVVQYLAETGLEPQIRQVVLCFSRPFRVQLAGDNLNSLSSALFYGYQNAPPPLPCGLNPAAENPLYFSGRAFRPADHTPRLYPTFQLAAPTPAAARTVITRSVAADFTHPAGTLHLLRTGDEFRNVQWPQFERADFLGRFTGSPVTWRLAEENTVAGQAGVIGVMAGQASHLPQVNSNVYVPGALADHLTSFGGIPYSFAGQMPAQDWLQAGCVASYGTVTEPCNYTNKFPNAELHFWYQRGFPAGEAYGMAVAHPYQGQTYGDPLCAPFATPPVVTLSGLASNAVVSGVVPLGASAHSPVAGRRIDRLELYVDERLHSVMFQAGPLAGNTVTATLGGTNFTHAVTPGQSLADVAAALAAQVDAQPALRATAGPDYVQVETADPAQPAAAWSAAASSAAGVATNLTLSAASATPTFLETRARARGLAYIEGTPTTNTALRLTLTRIGGVTVVKELTANPGEPRFAFLQRFFAAVNADPAFNHPDGVVALYPADIPSITISYGYLIANAAGPAANTVEIEWRPLGSGLSSPVLSGPLRDNADVLSSRAMLFLSAGALTASASASLDTTLLPDGPHTARVVAYEGTAVATPGSAAVPFVVDNHDLSATLTWPEPGGWVLQGSLVTGVVATAGAAAIVSTELWVEGKRWPSGLVWNSSAFGPGDVPVQARVRDALDREAWSPVARVQVLADADRDGLADAWETLHFGGLTALPAADADGDGRSNRDEFIADTQPTNAISRLLLSLDVMPNGDRALRFLSSPDRKYRIETSPLPPFAWTSAFPADVTGTGALFPWTDTSSVSNRLYRLRARLP